MTDPAGTLRTGSGHDPPPDQVHLARWADIAYQVLGDGPLDLVYLNGLTEHIDVQWEHPLMARFLERLTSFSRLIVGPTVWSTLALTMRVDGSNDFELVGASSFPRHWIYDQAGRLAAKTGLIEVMWPAGRPSGGDQSQRPPDRERDHDQERAT